MKRVFLTSGLILCMAAQANAVQTTDIGTGASNANCVETTLGVDNGSTSFEAKWEAKDYRVVYMCGTGATPTTALSITGTPTDPVFDSAYTFAASPASSCTKTGYSVNQWDCGSTVGSHAFGSTATWSWDLSGTPGSVTCNATWTPVEKTITLNINSANHGSAAGSPTTLYTRYDSGAYTDSGRTKLMSASANGLTTNPTGNTYTLTLNTNLSSLAQTHQESEVTAASGTKVASQSSAMTFKGFYSAATGGTQYIASTGKITTDGTNRAKGRTANDEWFAQYQCTNLTPYTPQLTGYTFKGWYDTAAHANAGESEGLQSTQCITGNKTIYAGWGAEQYNVTYDVGTHGTCPSATCTDDNGAQHVYVKDATYDQNYAARTYATVGFTEATGYTFKEWNTESNGNGVPYTGDTPWRRTSDLTVYAKYTPNISGAITLDSNKYASASATSVQKTATTAATPTPLYSAYDYSMYKTAKPTTSNYDTVPSSNCQSGQPCKITSIDSGKPTLTGYTFEGFYTGKAGSGTKVINADGSFTAEATTRISTTDDIATWYAHWTAKSYTVTYYACDGTTNASKSSGVTFDANYTPQTYGSSSPVNMSSWTVPDHYHFVTWHQNSAGGTARAPGREFKYTYAGNLKLYAQCDGDATNVTYTCGTGATGSAGTAASTAVYGSSYTYSAAGTCAKTGYNFDTWNCTATGYTAKGVGSTDNPWTYTGANGGSLACVPNWNSNISGAITLQENYRTATSGSGATYSTNSNNNITTHVNPGSVYSKYNVNLYDTAEHATSGGSTGVVSSITVPVKTGYTFNGFYNAEQVLGAAATGTQMINASGVVQSAAKTQVASTGGTAIWYASYSPKTTTVTYNCGNPVSGSASTASFKSGSGATVFDNPSNHSNTATYDASYTHPVGANTCQMAGYTFASWHCVQGTTPSVSGNTITNNGITSGKWSADMANVTCTAKWTQNEINLNYNANCASGTTCASWSNDAATQCTYDTTFNLPTQPAKTGYTFKGWTVASGNN